MLRSCSGTFQPLTANDLGVVETDPDSTLSATLVAFPHGAGDGLLLVWISAPERAETARAEAA
jgi:hypothetical protein